MSLYRDERGAQVRLGAQIAKGGEGTVFGLADDPHSVAKVYHQGLQATRAPKLREMVKLQSPELLSFTAWPSRLLFDTRGMFIGFTMRRVTGHKEAHSLYGPKSRRIEFPHATWAFLVRAALNLSSAFDAIHSSGHAIGDVNQSNVLFSDRATCVLIDCDSFQINGPSGSFNCEVGVPTFTPPELQGRQFSGVRRTANHDNFGLALLIFHLLYLGRHPFAGMFTGPGDMPIEKAIERGLYAYHRTATGQMRPPPNAPGNHLVSPDISRLFESAFRLPEAGQERPTAQQWRLTLRQMEGAVKGCTKNPSHFFYSSLANCFWCDLEVRTQFVVFATAVGDASSSNQLDELIRLAEQVPHPGRTPCPQRTSFSIAPRIAAPSLVNRTHRLLARAAGVGLAILGLGIGLSLGPSFGTALIVVAILWVGYATYHYDIGGHVTAARIRGNESRRDIERIETRWSMEAQGREFDALGQTLANLKTKVIAYRGERQRQLQRLHNEREADQLASFLDRFFIANEAIPEIGPARKTMLESYGIETAADVMKSTVLQVPGFGPHLTNRLLSWRNNIAKGFRFDPSAPVAPAKLLALEHILETDRKALEVEVSRLISRLQQASAATILLRQQLSAELERAYGRLAQAEADEISLRI
jgi:DNA-binding helix-hairpin-helix protein with protein kinase domain